MSAPRKPRDVGNGLVCASFGRGGEWLSLATVDPEVGFVELTGLPVFDPELHGNAEAVLRYRSWMRREVHAFLRVEAGRATVTTREDPPRGTRAVVQRLVIRASRRDRPAGIRIRVCGRLARPPLAEVREAGRPGSEGQPSNRGEARIPAAAGSKPRAKAREGTLRVSGEGAPVVIQAWLRKPGGTGAASAGHGSADDRSDKRLAWTVLRRRMPTAVAWIEWPAEADEVHLDIACAFDRPPAPAPEWQTRPALQAGGGPEAPQHLPEGGRPASRPAQVPTESRPPRATTESRPLRVPIRLVRSVGQLDQRAATYTRTCTALQVAGAERCILADHRTLPLSWTCDAYWQARLLLATWARGGHDDDAAIVADHLRWLFLRCERPDGRWLRTHHADGRRADLAFRADQQLYPLLELADFVGATGGLPELPPGSTWAELAGQAWAAAESAIDGVTALLATDVDAADAIPPHPFRASDQVLLWHTAMRLAGVARQLGLVATSFTERADRTRAAFDAHVVVDGAHARQWAGSVDGRGGVELSIEATDLPLALAPLWGFCKPTDRTWRATMAFALDAANPAFVPGPAGGLGSRHTPGTWTLGDIFAWVAHGLMGEPASAEAALARLVSVAFSDGMLPEAYDPEGSGDVVRHWFALPGAVLGALVLEHAARGPAAEAR